MRNKEGRRAEKKADALRAAKRPLKADFFPDGTGTRVTRRRRYPLNRFEAAAPNRLFTDITSSPSLCVQRGSSVQSTGRFSAERLARSRRPAINVFARLIEIYVLIHSRIGGIGEYIVPVGRHGGNGLGEWMGGGGGGAAGWWRGHNERREKELGGGHFVSVCLLLIYSDVPRLSAF